MKDVVIRINVKLRLLKSEAFRPVYTVVCSSVMADENKGA